MPTTGRGEIFKESGIPVLWLRRRSEKRRAEPR
jgi:hypothetical protein